MSVNIACLRGAPRSAFRADAFTDPRRLEYQCQVGTAFTRGDEGRAQGRPPKSKHGRRTVSLPPSAVDALRAHRRQQLEQRLALGQGRPDPSGLVFCTIEGGPLSPDNLSRDWRRVTLAKGLPRVTFHALGTATLQP